MNEGWVYVIGLEVPFQAGPEDGPPENGEASRCDFSSGTDWAGRLGLALGSPLGLALVFALTLGPVPIASCFTLAVVFAFPNPDDPDPVLDLSVVIVGLEALPRA